MSQSHSACILRLARLHGIVVWVLLSLGPLRLLHCCLADREQMIHKTGRDEFLAALP